jgi:anthranilate phosphoribosyltransferase
MVNPADPQFQLVGVFSLELARIFQYIYQQTDTKFSIVHSIDGYDEVSLTDAFKVISHNGEKLLKPDDIKLPPNKPEEIFGGNTVEDSASIFKKVLNGQGTKAQNNAVLANAALAIQIIDEKLSFEQCLEKASDSLKGGKAAATLKTLLEIV